jgi:protein-L-isoaspartate(D-aspartate) O-methyltransferase
MLWGAMVAGCTAAGESPPTEPTAPAINAAFSERTAEREAMVHQQLAARDIRDPAVLAAMRRVPRHVLIPNEWRALAYADHPLPIGHDQTISQPYIVAAMTQAAGLEGGETVLEVGTGSGYQAAVLAEIVAKVYTIEIVALLAERASRDLADLGYTNIEVRAGDGYQGWLEHAPFDAVLVTAAPPKVPQPLIDQLKIGGRLIIPVGTQMQELLRIERTQAGTIKRTMMPVRFVPMTGEAQRQAH